MPNKQNITFEALGATLTARFEKYANNDRLCIQLFDEEGPCTTLTCNLPGESLAEGEFFVKDWFPNEEIAAAALLSGHFIDTGRRVQSAHVMAPIWRITP